MANPFQFRQFTIHQEQAAMKVGMDSVILGSWTDTAKVRKILDVGTGTGILAIMMAQRVPEAHITAVEIDPAACRDARNNVQNCPWKNRIDVIPADVRSTEQTPSYDLIISNPPYFTGGITNPDVQKAIARHAMLLTTDELFKLANKVLVANGQIGMIFPFEHLDIYISAAVRSGFHLVKELRIGPAAGKPFHRVAGMFSRQFQETDRECLFLRNPIDHTYTTAYKTLTKDFYLYG